MGTIYTVRRTRDGKLFSVGQAVYRNGNFIGLIKSIQIIFEDILIKSENDDEVFNGDITDID